MEVKESLALEERVAKVEGILEEMRERLSHLETRTESGFSELRRELRSQFRWTLGIMLGVLIPMWVTIIFTILSH